VVAGLNPSPHSGKSLWAGQGLQRDLEHLYASRDEFEMMWMPANAVVWEDAADDSKNSDSIRSSKVTATLFCAGGPQAHRTRTSQNTGNEVALHGPLVMSLTLRSMVAAVAVAASEGERNQSLRNASAVELHSAIILS